MSVMVISLLIQNYASAKGGGSLLQSQTMVTSIRGTTRLLRMLVAISYVELLPVQKQEAPTLECLWNSD